MSRLLAGPRDALAEEHRYRLSPRERTSFHNVLSADDVIGRDGARTALVRSRSEAEAVTLEFEFPLARGLIREELRLRHEAGRLTSDRLVRSVFNADEQRVRHEEIAFGDGTIPLPEAAYPEVALPFLLRWQPFDGKTRDIYAWINDRFVARVEFESQGREEVTLPGGRAPAIKMIMYPDFNDWVRLGKVLTKLARPFIPKYHIWFAAEPPHPVLRFEGPYGPPGAPEIVMERLA